MGSLVISLVMEDMSRTYILMGVLLWVPTPISFEVFCLRDLLISGHSHSMSEVSKFNRLVDGALLHQLPLNTLALYRQSPTH